jgi:hypothetical protein
MDSVIKLHGSRLNNVADSITGLVLLVFSYFGIHREGMGSLGSLASICRCGSRWRGHSMDGSQCAGAEAAVAPNVLRARRVAVARLITWPLQRGVGSDDRPCKHHRNPRLLGLRQGHGCRKVSLIEPPILRDKHREVGDGTGAVIGVAATSTLHCHVVRVASSHRDGCLAAADPQSTSRNGCGCWPSSVTTMTAWSPRRFRHCCRPNHSC